MLRVSGVQGDQAEPVSARALPLRPPYRPARSFQHALDALDAAAGTQLDPLIVQAFGSVFEALPGMGSLDLLSEAGDRLVRGAHFNLADHSTIATSAVAGRVPRCAE